MGVVRRVVHGVVRRVVRGAGVVGSPRRVGQSFQLSRAPGVHVGVKDKCFGCGELNSLEAE